MKIYFRDILYSREKCIFGGGQKTKKTNRLTKVTVWRPVVYEILSFNIDVAY